MRKGACMLSVTPKQLQRILRTALLARFQRKPGFFNGSLMIYGDTAIGKTDSVEHAFDGVKCPACGEEHPMHVTQHLAQNAPEDIKGLYVFNPQKGEVMLHPNPDFRMNSKCPICYLLDEFNQVDRPIQKASLEFTLKHAIGGTPLPPGSIVVLAGNRASDCADVEDLVRPQRTRLTHLEMRFSFNDWKEWALRKGIHPYVIGYLNSKSEDCYKPDVGAMYGEALPRTWERVSEILYTFEPEDQEVLINGTIGEGMSASFMGWVGTAGTLMPLVDRVLAGENVCAEELSAQFFVNSILTDRFGRKPEAKMAERILQYAIYSADHNPEAAAVMQKDCCRISSAHRDKMMGSPSWPRAVARLAQYVV